MRIPAFLKPILIFFICLFPASTVFAQCAQPDGVIFVTNTNDEGNGSLREAIHCANNTAGPNTIRFNIPGLEDQIIYIGETSGTGLPALSDPETIIDGTTQAGFGFAGDFTPKVILDGSIPDWDYPTNGLTITGNKCQVLGLEIRNFPDDGIEIFQAANTRIGAGGKMNIIYSCGEEADYYSGAPGTGPWEGSGIHIRQNANNTRIINTIIGTDEDLNTNLGNEYCGIRNEAGSLNTIIGSTDPALGNTIVANQVGVLVTGSYNVFIRGNKMYCNQGDGIIVSSNSNFNKLPPVITTALPNQISGTGSNGDIIEVFRSNNVACAAGPAPCQGQQLIGTATVTAGHWTLNPPFLDGSTSLPNGVLITANATDFLNNSSAFAECGTVINTATCANSNGVIKVIDKSDAGEGTLRSAILCANAVPGPNRIEFTIQGQGPHINYVGSESRQPLPPLLDPGTVIDGTTQPLYGLNGNYKPEIILDGSLNLWNSPINALFIQSDKTEIYGLEIRNFPDDGIDINQADSCIIGGILKGNVIYSCGSPVDTFPALPNQGPWEGSGIILKNNASNCIVQGNTIGTNFTRTIVSGNEYAGIIIREGGSNHRIGGPSPGEGNYIAHNAAGIILKNNSSQINIEQNNLICNDSIGIWLEGNANNQQMPPTIDTANNQLISGTGIPGERIEVYRILATDCPDAVCQGGEFLGTTTVEPDGSWSLDFPLQNNVQLNQNDRLTATATDLDSNTSGFSPCKGVTIQCALFMDVPTYQSDTCEAGLGSLQLAAGGGFGPYQYTLDDETNSTGLFSNLQSGDYYVTITDTVGCLSVEFVNLPSVGLFTTANFSWSGDNLNLVFANESYYADSVVWDFGDTTFSSFGNPIFSFDTTGLYEVCLTSISNCSRDTICQIVPVFSEQDRLDFFIGKKSSYGGDTLYLPVTVKGFDKMLGFQFSLATDTSGARIIEVSNLNLPFLSEPNFLLSDSSVNCSWTDLSLDGISVPDSTILFEIVMVLDSGFQSCATLFADQSSSPSETVRYVDGQALQTSHRIFPGLACGIIPFSGTIQTETGAPVVFADVFVNTSYSEATDQNGSFNMIFRGEEGLPAEINAHKNSNASNGVTTYDMVRIQQHLLLLKELDSPYKIIAADVDNNKTISTFDLAQLRLVILGISTTFPNNESWRFIPADYQFDNPKNPLMESFPEHYTVEKPADFNQPFDFIGVKVGDVTEDANPAGFIPLQPVMLHGKMEVNVPGDQFRLTLSAESFQKLAAFQATVEADPKQVRLEKVKIFNSDIQINDQLLSYNTLPFLYFPANGEGTLMKPSQPLLVIEGYFKVPNPDLTNLFTLQSFPTETAAFSISGERIQIQLNTDLENVLLNNDNKLDDKTLNIEFFPNPFSQVATVRFDLPVPSGYELRVYRSNGQLIWNRKQDNPVEGMQDFTLDRQDFPGSGTYWIELKTSAGTRIKRFTAL